MTAVVFSADIDTPVDDSGRPFPYLWASADGRSIGSDSRSGIVSEMLGIEYDEADASEADVIRATHLLRAGNLHMLADMMASEKPWGGLPDAAVDFLNVPTLERSQHGYPERWDYDISLCVLADDGLPEGNVVVLDPSTETTFLDSLDRLGQGVLFLSETDDDE